LGNARGEDHAVPPSPTASSATIYGVFSKIDTNADGIISGQENEAFLQQTENQQRQIAGGLRTRAENTSASSPEIPDSAPGSFSALA
jgi:hypothetical protein